MSSTYYVADYCRFSSKEDDKRESNSIINQREINKEYIYQLQKKYPEDTFIHVDSYSDDDWTGTNFNRPDFKRLKADCLSGKINCIVVKDHSRFGRDAARMTVILEDDLEDIRYISNLDNFDSRFDDYDSMFQIKTTFNQMYAEDISRKVHSSIDTKQRQGKFVGSFCPYGYVKNKLDKNKLDIDENVRYVVEMIFNLRLQGINSQTIARRLNELEIPSPSNYKKLQGLNYFNSNAEKFEEETLWTFSTIYRMLTNETYMGNLVQGRKRQKMRKKPKPQDKSKWVVAKGAVPAIVSEETFLEVQRLMKKANHIKGSDTNNQCIHLFAGFIKCGECEHSFVKSLKNKNEKMYYACRTRKAQGKQYCDNSYIREDVLEKIILDDLNNIIQEITDLASLVDTNSIDFQKVSLENQIVNLKTAIEKTIKKRVQLYTDYRDDILSRQDYLYIKQDLDTKEQSFQEQMKHIQDKLNNWNEKKKQNPFISRLLEAKHIDALDRSILQEMIESIYIYKDNRIKITYKFTDEVNTLRDTVRKMQVK